MGVVVLIALVVVVLPLLILYLSGMGRKMEADKKHRAEKQHEASEKIMRPERKLHEAEKKRWEDEYWKRQEGRER
jgi:hypothetical protein